MLIYHITEKERWETGLSKNCYIPSTFSTEGFIHCSLLEYIPGVLNRYYPGVTGLVMLEINPEKLISPLVFEDLIDAGVKYPHIYGPLNPDAVTGITFFPLSEDSTS